MKKELKKHFRDMIVVTKINEKVNVVTFLKEFHNKTKYDKIDEKQQIIKSAAKLMKQDIKNITQIQKDTVISVPLIYPLEGLWIFCVTVPITALEYSVLWQR